jgi:hypothetical protein
MIPAPSRVCPGKRGLVSTYETASEPAPSGPVPADVRGRLAALTYLILPPGLGHTRRAAIAHRNVSQALGPGLTETPDQPLGPEELARLRVRVLRLALLGAGSRSRIPMPAGKGLGARTGDAATRDKALGSLIPAARAAHALRRVEGVSRDAALALLAGAGVSDPETAVRVSERMGSQIPDLGPADVPTAAWIRRRRQRVAGAFATASVVLIGGAAATMPGSGTSGAPELVPAAAREKIDRAPAQKVAATTAVKSGATAKKAPATKKKTATSATSASTAPRRTTTQVSSRTPTTGRARQDAQQAAAIRAAAEAAQATAADRAGRAARTATARAAATDAERRAAEKFLRAAKARQEAAASPTRGPALAADPSLPDGALQY